jgi:hypothetical protein
VDERQKGWHSWEPEKVRVIVEGFGMLEYPVLSVSSFSSSFRVWVD